MIKEEGGGVGVEVEELMPSPEVGEVSLYYSFSNSDTP